MDVLTNKEKKWVKGLEKVSGTNFWISPFVYIFVIYMLFFRDSDTFVIEPLRFKLTLFGIIALLFVDVYYERYKCYKIIKKLMRSKNN